MSRDVPYNIDAFCDICGDRGAWDLTGDYVCPECLDQKTDDAEDKDDGYD